MVARPLCQGGRQSQEGWTVVRARVSLFDRTAQAFGDSADFRFSKPNAV